MLLKQFSLVLQGFAFGIPQNKAFCCETIFALARSILIRTHPPVNVGGMSTITEILPDVTPLYLPVGGSSTIPYYIAWNAARNTYGETSSEKGNTQISCHIMVNWEDSELFSVYARGFAEYTGSVGSRVLRRNLPLKCPWGHELYLENLQAVEIGKDLGPDSIDGWPTAEWVKYNCTFSHRPYELKSDTYIDDGSFTELARYVARKRKWNYKERRINAYAIQFSDNTPVPVPSFVPIALSDIVYTWNMIPSAAVDYAGLDAALGKVNVESFDAEAEYLERGIGGPFAAGTLLFAGYAGEWNMHVMSNGEVAYDIPFLFKHNPNGWNKQLKSDGVTYDTVHIAGTSNPLYQTTAFYNLFDVVA